jgi:hypothetical protein
MDPEMMDEMKDQTDSQDAPETGEPDEDDLLGIEIPEDDPEVDAYVKGLMDRLEAVNPEDPEGTATVKDGARMIQQVLESLEGREYPEEKIRAWEMRLRACCDPGDNEDNMSEMMMHMSDEQAEAEVLRLSGVMNDEGMLL